MTTQAITMTEEDIERFLSEPRNAVLGTVRKNGSPQLSVVWFLYRHDKLYSYLYNSSAKYFNIRRDPRVVLCVNAAHPDARSVTLFGTAELIGQDDERYRRVERELAFRYHDTEQAAEAYLDIDADAEASAIVITPYRIIGEDYN